MCVEEKEIHFCGESLKNPVLLDVLCNQFSIKITNRFSFDTTLYGREGEGGIGAKEKER